MLLKSTNLKRSTVYALENCSSIHTNKSFRTVENVNDLWKKRGASGFLNIKEISPSMVQEIRNKIIES